MTNRRAKIAAGATVVGLAALGGVALGSNPGMPSAVQQGEAGATAAVTTGASGATSGEAALAAAKSGTTQRAPIVTRASGATGVPHDD